MGTLNMGEANSSSPNGFELISKSRAGVLGLSRLTARYIREWGGAVLSPVQSVYKLRRRYSLSIRNWE